MYITCGKCMQGGGQDTQGSSKARKTPSGSLPQCKLDTKTQELMELIFDDDMFTDAMAAFDIDVQKMPLGQLSQAQVQKGVATLLDLRCACK